MSEFPLGYEKIAPTTWVYLSSLLMLGLFFKFNRVFSVRNLDLVLLILLAPGLLLVNFGLARMDAAQETLGKLQVDVQQAAGQVAESAPSGEPPPPETEPPQPDVGEEASDTTANEQEERDQAKQQYVRGRSTARIGFIVLFAVCGIWLLRLLTDPMMVRRPLLEPNLSTGGLLFLGLSLFIFLMANVITGQPTADDLEGPHSAVQLVQRRPVDKNDDSVSRHGPGYAVLFALPSIPTAAVTASGRRGANDERPGIVRTWTMTTDDTKSVEAEFLGMAREGKVRLRLGSGEERVVPFAELSPDDQSYVRRIQAYIFIARTMSILSHLAIVVGIVLIGYWHFDNIKSGIGTAALYLMLPYTAMSTGHVDHSIPAALLIWAIVFYRRPIVAGIFIGLAGGAHYYALFLLPLWLSFYWKRGRMRFTIGVVTTLAVVVVSLIFISSDMASFAAHFRKIFGLWLPIQQDLKGIWALGWDAVFRLPILAAFFVLSGTFALWPAQKNLGTLLSCSAALMVAVQFWHGHGMGGGLYMAWFLPLTLLTVFRPNLEDRVALAVLGEGWFPRRWSHTPKVGKAA